MKFYTIFLIGVCLLYPDINAQTTPAHDAAMYKINLPNYSEFQSVTLTAIFRNSGTDTLRSVIINYTVNGGPVIRLQKDSLKIGRNSNWPFVAPDPLVINQEGDFRVKMWVSSPNGFPDGKSSNDTLTHTIQVIRQYPAKKILIEEVTGAWCGFCPRAPIIYKKSIQPTYPNTIFVAIHTGDGMVTSDSRDFNNTYVTGVPCGFVDRRKLPNGGKIDFSSEEWLNVLNQTDNRFNPAILNVYNYFDESTGDWKIDVVADFIFNMAKGDYRLNCYIVEDSLIGTGSAWEQRNFFNGSASDPYRELQGAGDPLPGYYHNHVVRKMLGGSWGQAGVIPESPQRGERYVYSKTIKWDSKWKKEHIHLVGILQLYSTDKLSRQILNSNDAKLSYKTGTEPLIKNRTANLFPNPAGNLVRLDLQNFDGEDLNIRIYDVTGKIRFTRIKASPAVAESIAIDLTDFHPGIYFVQVFNSTTSQTIRLIRE